MPSMTAIIHFNLQDHNLIVYQQNFNRDCHKSLILYNLEKAEFV